MLCKCRLRALHSADDVVSKCMERSSLYRNARPLLDSLRHFLGCVLRECEKKDFIRSTDACLYEVCSLCRNNAGFPRTSTSEHQSRILVDHYGETLFRRERLTLNGIKELLVPLKLIGDEGFHRCRSYRTRSACKLF